MKVFLDDTRPTPPGFRRVYTANEAISLCIEGKVEHLSLDYDLDCNHKDGYPHPGTGGDVTNWLLEQAENGEWERVPLTIGIHSSNEDGVHEMAWELSEIEQLRFAYMLGIYANEMR